MKKIGSIIAIVSGVIISLWCFMVVGRMLVLRLITDAPNLIAFIIYVVGAIAGVILILLGRKKYGSKRA
jgi:hypothetical protein